MKKYWLASLSTVLALIASFVFVASTESPNRIIPAIATSLVAIFAILVTIDIARHQNVESKRSIEILEKIQNVLVNQEDTKSLEDYESNEAFASTPDSPDTDFDAETTGEDANSEPPADLKRQAIISLKNQKAKLDFENLLWKRKVPPSGTRGNHGWFVESESGPDRWFIRKANGLTVRRALPRDLLDTLEEHGVHPTEIRSDFQLKEHGLAAWYARTYEGEIWKVSRSNRYPERGPRVERIEQP